MLLTGVFLTSHTALHPGPRGPISDGSPGRFDCRGTSTFASSSACLGPWKNNFRPENTVCGTYIICLVKAHLHSLDILWLRAWPWTLGSGRSGGSWDTDVNTIYFPSISAKII